MLRIAAAAAYLRCWPSMNRALPIVVAIVVCAASAAFAAAAANAYPILAIPKTAGSSALLKYELTSQERKLFVEMDTRTAKLPRDATTAEYHAVAAEVGKKYGLSREESIAFFVRTTFSYFEP